MYEIAVPILAFVAVILLGAAIITGQSAAKKRLQARLEYDAFSPDPLQSPHKGGLLRLIERAGELTTSGGHSNVLRENLAKAGYHNAVAPKLYMGTKMILLAGGLFAALVAVIPTNMYFPAKAVIVLGTASFLFFVPNIYVTVRRQHRQTEIRHHIPGAVDLLEICVSSGMGLDMAWNMVADEIRGVSTHLADEMALTNLEMHLGASRVEAMRHMAERTGAIELGALVAVLSQSERFGTSISHALKTFASSMREERSAMAEENAEKTAVKLIFPMVFLIFPAMLIVMIGPASIRFEELLGQ